MLGKPDRELFNPRTMERLISSLRVGIYITDKTGHLIDANPAFLELFGFETIEEMRSYKARELLVDPRQRIEEIASLLEEGFVKEYEIRIRRPDGEIRTLLDTAYAVEDSVSGDTLFHGVLVDITRRKQLEQKLRELSTRDPLTGCYNRRYLRELQRRLHAEGARVGAIVIDIDYFKQYNDVWGHKAGDEALIKLSRFLNHRIRSNDAVIRLGGDEFLVLVVGGSPEATELVVERLRERARLHSPVPFSLGWTVQESSESLDETIQRADQNLIRIRVEERLIDRRGSTGR